MPLNIFPTLQRNAACNDRTQVGYLCQTKQTPHDPFRNAKKVKVEEKKSRYKISNAFRYPSLFNASCSPNRGVSSI
jgi:hypothetical protein